jgi:hypothetical protein
MLAVGISYRQTIRAYPQGGGSFIVASEELGRVVKRTVEATTHEITSELQEALKS